MPLGMIVEQAKLMVGAKKAPYRPKTKLQSVLVALSALFYLAPVVSCLWVHSHHYTWKHDLGIILFTVVTIASAVADGGLLEWPWFPHAMDGRSAKEQYS